MYKISNLLFNIEKIEPDFTKLTILKEYFKNFDSIIYFFRVTKHNEIKTTNLNHIIEYGLKNFNPTQSQLLVLFENIMYFNNINNKYVKYIFDNMNKLDYNIFKVTNVPAINPYIYQLMKEKNYNIINNKEYNNLSLYSYFIEKKENIVDIKNKFKSLNLNIDSQYTDFLKNKKDLYCSFKNFDNDFYFVTDYNGFEFDEEELKLTSHKTTAVPIASEDLYSLYYAIDLTDNKTKIFIGETQDFDDRNTFVANNFDELINSKESLLKIYDFMKADSLAKIY